MEWNENFGIEYERYQNRMEWKISRMEWMTIFHTSIPNPYYISFMAFAEKYNYITGIPIVITTNMWKRLAANHLSAN